MGYFWHPTPHASVFMFPIPAARGRRDLRFLTAMFNSPLETDANSC